MQDRLIILERTLFKKSQSTPEPPLSIPVQHTPPTQETSFSFNENFMQRKQISLCANQKVIFKNARHVIHSTSTLSAHDHQGSLQVVGHRIHFRGTYHSSFRTCSINRRGNIFNTIVAKNEHLNFVTQAYDTVGSRANTPWKQID